jgi:uncharacterized protein YjeT (DUF2065 family)
MKHLKETGYTYFAHMRRAFCIAFVLVVHGIVPGIWTDKATQMLCNPDTE